MKHVLAILIGALLGLVAQASRDLDRMPPYDARLLVSFNRGDASDMSYAKRTPTLGAGATFASRALDLSGTSTGWVTYPDADALDTLPLTVVFWLYIDSYSGVRSLICKRPQATSYTGWGVCISPGYLSRGLVVDVVQSADATVTSAEYVSSWTGSGSLSAATWCHVAVVMTGFTSHPSIYLNGVAQSVTTAGTGSSVTSIANTEPVRLGLKGGPESPFWTVFDGKIDNLGIFGRAWSAAEIAAAYASGRP